MRITTPEDLARMAIQPVVDYCRAHRGAVVQLHKEMERLSGLKWKRQQIESYLNADESRRPEPRIGMALLLMVAAVNIMQGVEEVQAGPCSADFPKLVSQH